MELKADEGLPEQFGNGTAVMDTANGPSKQFRDREDCEVGELFDIRGRYGVGNDNLFEWSLFETFKG